MSAVRAGTGARRSWGLVAAGGLLGSLACGLAPAPAHAAEGEACDPTILVDSQRYPDAPARSNPALERMNVPAAQEIADGTGVRVAVVDTGIGELSALNVVGRASTGGSRPMLLSGHGTVVAGLIAGPNGVAPGAGLYDVRAYDRDGADPTQGERALDSRALAAALNHVADVAVRERIGVVNVSLAVRAEDPALEAAVARLVALDVVVVAAAGNRPTQESGAALAPASERDPLVLPADLPGVVAVSAVGSGNEDLREFVLPNADTDVAAPTLGALSMNLTGQRCVVGQIATSWASAEVAGVVALLRQQRPNDTAAQIVGRLTATAEGSSGGRHPWLGAGVVQAHDALTRTVSVGRNGVVKGRSVAVSDGVGAREVVPPADPYGDARRIFLWVGLGALGVIAASAVARPFGPRRTRD